MKLFENRKRGGVSIVNFGDRYTSAGTQGLQAIGIKSRSTFANDWLTPAKKWQKFAGAEALMLARAIYIGRDAVVSGKPPPPTLNEGNQRGHCNIMLQCAMQQFAATTQSGRGTGLLIEANSTTDSPANAASHSAYLTMHVGFFS